MDESIIIIPYHLVVMERELKQYKIYLCEYMSDYKFLHSVCIEQGDNPIYKYKSLNYVQLVTIVDISYIYARPITKLIIAGHVVHHHHRSFQKIAKYTAAKSLSGIQQERGNGGGIFQRGRQTMITLPMYKLSCFG